MRKRKCPLCKRPIVAARELFNVSTEYYVDDDSGEVVCLNSDAFPTGQWEGKCPNWHTWSLRNVRDQFDALGVERPTHANPTR